MWALIDKIPYPVLVILAVWMGLAPFRPMPHLLEKLNMLLNGSLHRPIDIFDLFFHLAPTLILLLKGFRSLTRRHIDTER
jgi:hypothetical protein